MKMKRGVSILIAILVISVVLATGLAVANIFILELRTSGLASESVQALYAAESAVEWRLYEVRYATTSPQPVMTNSTTFNLVSGSSTSTIKAIGIYTRNGVERARRAFETTQ